MPARDAPAPAVALRRLIASLELRARLGARGRARAIVELGVERVIAETLDVYAALLDRPGEEFTATPADR